MQFKLIFLFLIAGQILQAQIFHQGFGIERSFRLRQLAREARNGDANAAYKLGMEYALREDSDKRNAFKALDYLKLADSLGSKKAQEYLLTILDDTTWMMDSYGMVLWHFKMRTLVLGGLSWEMGGQMLELYYKDIRRIAPFVDTLIISNPNGYLDAEVPPDFLFHTDYSIFTNVKVMVWLGGDAEYLFAVPEKVLNLPSLRKLYLCQVVLDSAITKKFYGANPGLQIVDINLEYQAPPPEFVRLLRYTYRRPEND